MANVDSKQLVKVLNKHYNTSELQSMCFDLGIDYENLGGQGKSDKARELVQFAQRHGRLGEVIDYVRRTRPFIQLNMRDTPPKTVEVNGRSEPSVIIKVEGDYIQGDKMKGDKVDGDKITVGDISGSTVAIGRKASAEQKADNRQFTVSGGNVIGNFGDGDFHNEGNMAMGDINIGGKPIPKTREEFAKQLQALKALLEEAQTNEEFTKSRDGKKALKAVEDVAEELDEDEPDKVTITTRLNELKTRLEGAASVVKAAGKVGAAVIKAVPILAALRKLAQAVF